MSRSKEKYGWLNVRPNSAKTAMERAKREVPGFADHIEKFEHQIAIKSYSESTVFSYSRSIAQVSLYFKKSPLELDPDEINSYLHGLATTKGLSSTYFKHAVYGLRFFFRVYGLEDRALRLPSMKEGRKLPVVFSQGELRLLFKAPQRLWTCNKKVDNGLSLTRPNFGCVKSYGIQLVSCNSKLNVCVGYCTRFQCIQRQRVRLV